LIFLGILRIAKKDDNKYFVKMKGSNENRKWGYQGEKK